MSTHNIGFYEDLIKDILNYHQIYTIHTLSLRLQTTPNLRLHCLLFLSNLFEKKNRNEGAGLHSD